MSSVMWSDLPHFDTGGSQPISQRHQQILFGKMPEDDAQMTGAGDLVVEETSDDAQAATVEPADDCAELESLVSALSGSLEEIATSSQKNSVLLVQAIATQLFPALAKEFLAEEIGRHLPDLVPDSAPTIEVRVTGDLTEKLTEIISRDKVLVERCQIIASPSQAHSTVDVSWRTGGINFDFESLLSACLDRLDQTQTTSEE